MKIRITPLGKEPQTTKVLAEGEKNMKQEVEGESHESSDQNWL